MSTGSWLSNRPHRADFCNRGHLFDKGEPRTAREAKLAPETMALVRSLCSNHRGISHRIFLVYLGKKARKVNENKRERERDARKLQIAGLNQSIEMQTQNNETQYLRHQQELRALQDQVSGTRM